MPVTSYMLKTSLFFLLKGSFDVEITSEALIYAHEMSDEFSKVEKTNSKLKFKPNPRWITESDIQEYAEDARIVAIKIFRFIHFLAKRSCKVKSYWTEPGIEMKEQDEMDYITDICEVLLERLQKKQFF